MLQNLHVKNLALIDESEVEFGEGLNILSGETGAGKSIIIGSINLALGQKVPKEMLRDNGESAYVELIFTVEDEDTAEKLRALDIDCEDDQVILSRKITGGRAVGRINGEAASASSMREAASLLIDIHGQHEHQSLLARKNHLDILDSYARESLGERQGQLAALFRDYKRLREEYRGADLDGEERKKELSFLEYEVHEIREAALVPGEDSELEERFKRFSNGKKILEAVNAAYGATGGEQESAAELTGYALRQLQGVAEYDSRLGELSDQLGEVDSLLADLNRELSGYLSDTEFDDETFFETQKRLDLINHLKSKYGDSIEEILEACGEKEQRMEVLGDYDAYLEKLKKDLDLKEKELSALCEEVSAIRRSEAEKLAERITENLKELNFLEVSFVIDFARTSDYTAKGTDDVQFMISTNPGEPVKPLDKVASGGELSRIMLAIKSVMADSDHIGTLIFDEIDSGISGRTAQMVAEKMKLLAKSHQIISITHLPQIAAMADEHFLIEKSVENQSTVSSIRPLDKESAVAELARMLGGVEITDTVMESAREMKRMASEL